MSTFWAESLSTFIHNTHGQKRNTPALHASANSPHLNDLYKSRDDSVGQPADVFVCFHGEVVGWSVLICVH